MEHYIKSSNEMFKNPMQLGFYFASVHDKKSGFYAEARFYFSNKQEEHKAIDLAHDFVQLHESMQ